tara:strand:- start:1349 stop:1858 length:510 start_codon:yes stop_codon:yes gene_type:complete
MSTADMQEDELSEDELSVVEGLGAYQFECQVASRPEHMTRVKTRNVQPCANSAETRSHRLFLLFGKSTVLGYVEYTCLGSWIYVDWIASWGREHGCAGVASRLLREVICRCQQDEVKMIEARLVHRKCDPVWLLAAEQNLFTKAGFKCRYWIWEKDQILYDMKLKLNHV